VTYSAGDYWLVYGRSPLDAQGHACMMQPNTMSISARVGDDNFQEGALLLSTSLGGFYSASVGVGQFHTGEGSYPGMPRIYFSGNLGPTCATSPFPCSDLSTAIGVLPATAPARPPTTTTSYQLKTASSNEVLSGWPATNVLDRNQNTAYSSLWHPTADNTTGVSLSAWRPMFTDGVYGPALVNGIRLTPRYGGYGFPTSYDLYLTTERNDAWSYVGRSYATSTGAPVTIPLRTPRGTWGLRIVPQQLGADDYGSHYLQLSDVELLLQQ
jgi:hypothetical protein